MANFYGQYIGFGAAPAGSAGGVYIGGRGLIGGGYYGNLDMIEYTTISSEGNSIDFAGDLTVGRHGLSALAGGATSSSRGVWLGGGNNSGIDTIDYITIANTGADALDWGAGLTEGRMYGHGCSNGVRGVKMGGSRGASYDIIDYITLATTGSCLDFGNLDVARYGTAACADVTKGIEAGGYPNDGANNIIQYINFASIGNAIDFNGNLLEARYFANGCSNSTRGLFWSGSAPKNTIQYITMANTGADAQDFGNLAADIEAGGTYASETRGVYSGGFPPVYSSLIQFVTIASEGNASTFGNLVGGKGATLGACSGD